MTNTEQRWFHRRGELSHDGWESVVDPAGSGLKHAGVRIADLHDGQSLKLEDRGVERVVIPLAGEFWVTHHHAPGEWTTHLHGRVSVFAGPTDVLYIGVGARAEVRGVGRVAIAEAPASKDRYWRYVEASSVPVELRGSGRSSRQVHNFGTPKALDAERLIVCEVITPAENWSSYPPHKHDQRVPGHESRLEEIYYFEAAPVAASNAAADAAFGLFSSYSSPAGDIDINAMVRTGDIALVPYGYHGPAVAAPGYDLYYLNVMAGPDPEREWLISDDPAHTWVRDTWIGQSLDDRLPYTTEGKGPR